MSGGFFFAHSKQMFKSFFSLWTKDVLPHSMDVLHFFSEKWLSLIGILKWKYFHWAILMQQLRVDDCCWVSVQQWKKAAKKNKTDKINKHRWICKSTPASHCPLRMSPSCLLPATLSFCVFAYLRGHLAISIYDCICSRNQILPHVPLSYKLLRKWTRMTCSYLLTQKKNVGCILQQIKQTTDMGAQGEDRDVTQRKTEVQQDQQKTSRKYRNRFVLKGVDGRCRVYWGTPLKHFYCKTVLLLTKL